MERAPPVTSLTFCSAHRIYVPLQAAAHTCRSIALIRFFETLHLSAERINSIETSTAAAISLLRLCIVYIYILVCAAKLSRWGNVI